MSSDKVLQSLTEFFLQLYNLHYVDWDAMHQAL